MAVALKVPTPIHEDEQVITLNWWVSRGLFAAVGLLALSLIGNVIQVMRPTPMPAILEVNHQGEPVGRVYPVTSLQAIPNAIIRARLADFIHDAFTVDKAHDEALYLRNKTYAAIPKDSQAFQAMTDWYEKDDSKFDPSLKNFRAWVEAQPIATFALPAPDTYQIDFTMTVHANNDQNKIISKWRAILHVIAGHSNNPESGAMFVDNIDLERE